MAVWSPDLLERCILLKLEKIEDSKRIQEKEFYENLYNERSSILGGVFDILSNAIQIKAHQKVTSLSRMADFEAWGYAVGDALESGGGIKFLKAYRLNKHRQNLEIIQQDTVSQAVLKILSRENPRWEGTITELLNEIRDTAINLGTDPDKDKYFPKAANALSRHINKMTPILESVGVKITHDLTAFQRTIVLEMDFQAYEGIEKDMNGKDVISATVTIPNLESSTQEIFDYITKDDETV